MTTGNEARSESVIGYVMIGGLGLSVALLVAGIVTYYLQSGSFAFQFTPQWQMSGPNFFAYFIQLLGSLGSAQGPIALMAGGVVVLMLTSYARVFATLLYFAFVKNLKYTAISLFLLAVLTVTLVYH